jgi:hypothetical protein
LAAANATSSPSTKIGRTIATIGEVAAATRVGIVRRDDVSRCEIRNPNERVAVASPRGPRNPAMPLPCETSSPRASVRPTAKSRTS